MGKAGGAFVQSMLLMLMATKDILAIAPVAAIMFIGVCVLWIYAVKGLSVQVSKASKN